MSSESGNVVTITDANFAEEVLKSEMITLVDFWAGWCAPCKIIAPTVEELANEYAGKVKVGKLNVDENPGTPGKFGIRGIPALLVFKNGQVVDQVVGVQSKSTLKQLLDKHL